MKPFFLFFLCMLVLRFNVSNKSKALTVEELVMQKNYPLTFLLKQHGLDEQLTKESKDLTHILSVRKANFNGVKAAKDFQSFIKVFKWSTEEADQLKQSLGEFWDRSPKFKNIVEKELFITKKYGQPTGSLKDYMLKALEQDIYAVNYAIDVYGAGKKPNYPKIDSISFDTSSVKFLELIQLVHEDISKEFDRTSSYLFSPAIAALRLLEVNERWDAALLEPLTEGENKLAITAIAHTDFSKYKYSSLIVLGSGPSAYNQKLSPKSMLRCRNAARNYLAKLVPFIIVSGGRVHPYKTEYIEALEMKKYLMHVLNIPESSIIIEPHARHTTTNMRNVGRMLFDYKFPTDQFAVINSHEENLNMVMRMANRCKKELGYVPYELGNRVNIELLEFKPTIDVYTVDRDEPLDP